MKVLITGGSGFIGSHVADAYLESGCEVIIVDNLSSGNLKNLPHKARFYLVDICSAEMEKIFQIEKPDIVNHHAAQISITLSTRDPAMDSRINSLGMLNVLELAVKNNVKKVIFSSTGGAIYGDTDQIPTPEDCSPYPLSPYGIHKYLGEQYLRFYNHEYGLGYTVLRYANVYGPRQNPHGEAGVVAIFINALLNNKTPVLYAYPEDPDGMIRDYVFVEDIARANLLAAEKGSNEIINIGTTVPTSTGALYREIAESLKKDIIPDSAKARPGDLKKSCLDIKKAKEILDWMPLIDLHNGVIKTIDYFRLMREAYGSSP